MELIIRPTTEADIPAAEACLVDGKAALASLGVPQWLGDYPNHLDIEADMADASWTARRPWRRWAFPSGWATIPIISISRPTWPKTPHMWRSARTAPCSP